MKFSVAYYIPLLLAGLTAAATTTTTSRAPTASSTDFPSLVASLPKCALPCFESAAKSVNCRVTDFTCLCTLQDKLVASLGPCIITSSCKPDEINSASALAPKICDAVMGAQPSEVASASAIVTSALAAQSTNAAAPARTALPMAAAGAAAMYAVIVL